MNLSQSVFYVAFSPSILRHPDVPDFYSEDAHYDEIIGYTQRRLAIFLNVGECWNITTKQSTIAFFQMPLLADRAHFLILSCYV